MFGDMPLLNLQVWVAERVHLRPPSGSGGRLDEAPRNPASRPTPKAAAHAEQGVAGRRLA